MINIKKYLIVGCLALAAMASCFAADIRFSGMFAAVFYTANADKDPDAADSGNKIVHGIGNRQANWSNAGRPQGELNMFASAGYFGSNLGLHVEGESFVPGEVNMWVKPLGAFRDDLKDVLQVHIGKDAGDPRMRGDACFGMWNYNRVMGPVWCGAFGTSNEAPFGSQSSEGWTFQKGEVNGVVLDINPFIEGLAIEISAPLNFENPSDAEDVWAYDARYLMSYELKNYAKFKLGYLARRPNYYLAADKDVHKVEYGFINAAVDFFAVDNLFVSVGAYIPTYQGKEVLHTENENLVNDGDRINFWDMYGTRINFYARYSFEPLTFHLIGGLVFNTVDQSKGAANHEWNKHDAFGFLIGGGIDYALPYNITLNLDVRYANDIFVSRSSDEDSDSLSFGIGVEKNFFPAKLRLAFQGATNNINVPYQVDKKKNGDHTLAWCVPLVFEVYF